MTQFRDTCTSPDGLPTVHSPIPCHPTLSTSLWPEATTEEMSSMNISCREQLRQCYVRLERITVYGNQRKVDQILKLESDSGNVNTNNGLSLEHQQAILSCYVKLEGIKMIEDSSGNSEILLDKSNVTNNLSKKRNQKVSRRNIHPCKTCGKLYQQKGYLISHQRIHSGETPYECDICNKKFKRKSILKTHIQIHMDFKPYSCDDCGKQFRNIYALMLHIRTHTGEKPHACKICKRKFADPTALLRHTRTHTGVKPYTCKVCGKKFTTMGNLKIHAPIHTGEKNHICNVCGTVYGSLCSDKRYIGSAHVCAPCTDAPQASIAASWARA